MKSFIVCLGLILCVSAYDCRDSTSSDQLDISARQFRCEFSALRTFEERWSEFASKLNFTRNADLVNLYYFMRNETASLGIRPVNGSYVDGGFIFTKSTGDIVVDATLPVETAIWPAIVTHGGRYEFAKAQGCREDQIVVYNSYYVPRLAQYYRFYARATRTTVDREWMTFRIHIRKGIVINQCK